MPVGFDETLLGNASRAQLGLGYVEVDRRQPLAAKQM
jgi:hypothetical protein